MGVRTERGGPSQELAAGSLAMPSDRSEYVEPKTWKTPGLFACRTSARRVERRWGSAGGGGWEGGEEGGAGWGRGVQCGAGGWGGGFGWVGVGGVQRSASLRTPPAHIFLSRLEAGRRGEGGRRTSDL